MLSVAVVSLVFFAGRVPSESLAEEPPSHPSGGLRFTVLHTNDLHSRLTGSGPDAAFNPDVDPQNAVRGHTARMLSLIEDLRADRAARAQSLFMFDSGDFFGGSLFQALSPRPDRVESPELEFFVRAGYDAISLGNHEFDAGEEGLRVMLAKKDVPLVISNLGSVPEEHFLRKFPWRRKFEIKSPGGDTIFRFSVLGGVGIDAARVSQNQRLKAGFIGYSDLSSAPDPKGLWRHLQTLVNAAREDSDAVFLLWHGGYPEDQDIAREVRGIDLILAGHIHQVYSPVQYINGVWIAQSGRYGETLGVLDLIWAGGRLHVARPENPVVEIDGSVAANRAWLTRIDHFKAVIDPLIEDMGWKFDQPVTLLKEDRIRKRSLHHPVVIDTLTRVKRSLDAKLNEPVDFYVTGVGLLREDLRTNQGRPTTLLFSDIYRVFAIGFDSELRPGSSVVHFWVRREDVSRMIQFLDAYRSVSANFTPAFSDDIVYQTRWWGIPLVNRVRDLHFRGRPLSEGPELFHVATSEFAARFLTRFPQLSRGFVDIRIRDREGRPLDAPLVVPGVTEATLFADGFQEPLQ